MTAENNIDIKIKELAQSIAPDEKLVENVMKHIDTESTDGSYGTTQNTWRIIIKSPITKFAAAVLAIAVLIYIDPFNGYLNGTTAAYAKVKEAVRNVPWMHISYS
jgi:hypothetical protein